MTNRPSYKQTLFDRLGPDAGARIRSYAYGVSSGGLTFCALCLASATGGKGVAPAMAFVYFLISIVVGVIAALVPVWMSEAAGRVVHEVAFAGSTTPYTQQHSYQQALVMQGRLDEALDSLEAVIAEPGSTADVRIRAAELYTREAKNHARAAELFREVVRHPKCTVGEEVYSANRLADLYTGPLAQPGRALVELRRLADRYPGSQIGERALGALKALKALRAETDQPAG